MPTPGHKYNGSGQEISRAVSGRGHRATAADATPRTQGRKARPKKGEHGRLGHDDECPAGIERVDPSCAFPASKAGYVPAAEQVGETRVTDDDDAGAAAAARRASGSSTTTTTTQAVRTILSNSRASITLATPKTSRRRASTIRTTTATARVADGSPSY